MSSPGKTPSGTLSGSTQMIGDQEPEETLAIPMITICSNSIRPCPRRHCWSTLSSNGNSCSASANVYEGELPTYNAISLEIFDMPFNALGEFLDQLTLGHRFWWSLVIIGGELSARLLAMGRTPTRLLTPPTCLHCPWLHPSMTLRLLL